MGQNKGTTLPNSGAMGGVQNPIPANGSPIGFNGTPQQVPWWMKGGSLPGPGNSGDQMGGGDPNSQASTAAFNQFLQQQMQSGNFGNMLSSLQNPLQANQYMRLLQPGARSGMGQPGAPTMTPQQMPPMQMPQAPITQNPSVMNPNEFNKYAPDNRGNPQTGFAQPPANYPLPSNVPPFGGNWNVSLPEQFGMPGASPVSMAPQGMTPPSGFNPSPQVNLPPNFSPTFDPSVNPNTSAGSNFGAGSPYLDNGGVNLGNVNGQYNAPNYNPFGGTQPGNIGASYDPNNAGGFSLGMGLGGSAQLGSAGSADVNGQFGTAVQQIMQRDLMKGVADMRNRYGMSGGSNLGSAAQVGEGTLRAEALPQMAAALGNINLQERGLNLQSRGQDLQNYLGSRGLDVNQLGMMAGNQQFGAGLGLQAGMSNQNNAMNWQQLMSQNNQFGNLYGQNNAQFGANFGQNADQMNNQNMMQNSGMMNAYGLGMGSIGMQQQQMQQQAQQFAFQQMMQAFQAQAGWNTPQAENVVQPSGASQWLSAGATAADIYAKIRSANK